ncbi:MAG: hypothetical protein ABIJ53_10220 [Verrucomicrobiota bacterium]
MKRKNGKTGKRENGAIFGHHSESFTVSPFRHFTVSLAGLLMGLAIAGCTTPQANPNRPEEHLITVQASQLWQPSGISANRGNIIHCVATGQWSDSFAKYGADGNPDTMKTHMGISAPASGLLMRFGNDTNIVYFIGKETNVVAGSSGELKFRNNFSLSLGMHGELKVRVTVAPDTDGDGISDYEEINTWKTNPLRVDSDGDGFSDLEEINDRSYRPTVPVNVEW